MRQPADQFASYLRRLRQERGWGSTTLSKAVGRSRTYLGVWERDAGAVPKRDVLDRVAEVLELSKTDRNELLRLAASRSTGSLVGYSGAVDPDANLLSALLEVEHDWPSEPSRPNPRSERAQLFIASAAWALAEAVATRTTILPPFSAIRWPRRLSQLGIVPDLMRNPSAIPVPKELVEEEMPFVDELTAPPTPADTYTQSLAMARIYRRLLFSDFARARQAAELLQHWSYDLSQPLAECTTLRFRLTDIHEHHGLKDVSCDVVSSLSRRSLACYLWVEGNRPTKGKKPAGWYAKAEHCDWVALSTIAGAFPAKLISYEIGQDFRNASYITNSSIFDGILGAIRATMGVKAQSQQSIEDKLRGSPDGWIGDDPVGVKPWLLSGVDPHLLAARGRALLSFVPDPNDKKKASARRSQ